ncbi:growth hormone secretagogue receptor type 1-like [Convolutriloba macropyga]|uniref:growth hormone secretagogue receptor type 1-like n=1 Tax=Convolutriloba macropyga TaxID=536237 RepID=UPI003F51F650
MGNFTFLFDVFSCVYAAIALPGVFGNMLVLVVIAVNKTMHTTTNFFLASMALSDLVFLCFSIPLNIYVLQTGGIWNLGHILCSLFWYLMYVSMDK